MLAFAPLLYRLAGVVWTHARLGRTVHRFLPGLAPYMTQRSLEQASSRTWVMHPPEKVMLKPAIFEADDLNRITGVDSDSSFEKERERIYGGYREYRPTLAYQLSGVLLHQGHLLLPGLIHRITTEPIPWLAHGHEHIRDEAFLVASYNTSRYFGHWLMDETSRILLGPQLGRPVTPRRPMSRHQTDYLVRLDLHPSAYVSARFDRLVVLDERNMNTSRRNRLKEIRRRARAPVGSGGREIVMLLRKRTGATRILVNEEEIAEVVVRQGGIALCPLEHDLDTILHHLYDARIVIGVEGSHTCHAFLVMRDKGSLITLQPPSRFNNILKPYCDALDLNYAFIVGEEDQDGFKIDPNRLLRMLDRVASL